MFDELERAGTHLLSALEQYRDACSTVESYCRKNDLTTAASDRISSELSRITTFTRILENSKSSIAYSQNSSRHVVPIHTLPPEILIHIIELAVESGHRMCRERESSKPHCSSDIHRQPNVFASVCILWRNLMLQHPSFWSQIPVVHVNGVNPRFMAYARLWAERARPAPLELHIATSIPVGDSSEEKASSAFLTSIADHRSGSLSFTFYDLSRARENTILNEYLSNWQPGTLKKLGIARSRSCSPYSFIKSTDSTDLENASVITLPHQNIEAFWKPIEILRLQGIYIDWGSQAYHGLVELCLFHDNYGPAEPPAIPDSKLILILTSSPGLQVLRFGILVEDTTTRIRPLEKRIVPVQLDHLQILDLNIRESTGENGSSLARILRMISPGQKSLELLLPRTAASNITFENRDEIHNFILRSRVVQLGLGASPSTLEWLPSAPQLQTLIVSSRFHETLKLNPSSTLLLSLDRIYVLRSSVVKKIFHKWLMRYHLVQKLVFWDCNFWLDNRVVSGSDINKLPEKWGLLDICSEVEVIYGGPPPIWGWERSYHNNHY